MYTTCDISNNINYVTAAITWDVDILFDCVASPGSYNLAHSVLKDKDGAYIAGGGGKSGGQNKDKDNPKTNIKFFFKVDIKKCNKFLIW